MSNIGTIEQVLIRGDLSKLSESERIQYYKQTCESLGLNPLTKPFDYITLNGKMTLYAKRDCADQLRKINGISIQVVSKEIQDGMIIVHVKGTDKTGRSDEDFGAIHIGEKKGDDLANAILKTVTKAKRRLTLSLSGLGFLDETEVEAIPSATKPNVIEPQVIKAPSYTLPIALPTDKGWTEYGKSLAAALKSSENLATLDTWYNCNKDELQKLWVDSPKMRDRIDEVYKEVKENLASKSKESAE